MSDISAESVQLTQTVKKGGCAAKLPAGELRKALSGLKIKTAPQVTVGVSTLDDASLWNLGDGRYLIQTLDFFTPIVDDPFDFGAIAAANALSDIYAMGGEPATAMSILAFPTSVLPTSLIGPLMEGALNKIHESGASLVGGHSIDDETLKLGFSVSGFVDHARAWTNAGAQPGDFIVLTKALGTGTLMSALKSRKCEAPWLEAALLSMKKLNRAPGLLPEIEVHAATDITGFGLAGHLLQVAQASGVSVELDLKSLPLLPGFDECLSELEIRNRAHSTNRAYVQSFSNIEQMAPIDQAIVTDAQTSGGLALFVSPDVLQKTLECLRTEFPATTAIGRVLKQQDLLLQLRP